MNSKKLEAYSPLILFIFLLVLWQAVCSLFSIPEFIFPSPIMIGKALAEFTNPIAFAAWQTFWVTMVGFGISIVVGVLLGFLVGSARIAYTAMFPLLVAFNAVPKAAIVPILVVWFGIGVGPGILTAFLISFFPITVNIATGLARIRCETLGRTRQSRFAALVAVFLRFTQNCDYAGICGYGFGRNDSWRFWHWLLDANGRLAAALGIGFCWLSRDWCNGDGDV